MEDDMNTPETTQLSDPKKLEPEEATQSEFSTDEMKEIQRQMLDQLSEINKQLAPTERQAADPAAYFSELFEEVKK